MRLSWRILAIAVATLSLWLGSAAWAVSSPVASSPDDDYHLAMIYCAGGKADCERGGARMRPCFAFSAAVTGDCTPPANIPLPTSPGDARRATFDLGTLTTPATYGIITGWYPPLYYEVNSWFIGENLAQTTLAVRLVSVTLGTLAAVGSVLLSSARLRPAVALSWMVCSVPLGMFVMSSLNPQSWTIIGLAALWGPLLSFLTEAAGTVRGVARLVWVEAAAVMALGSRSEPPYFLAATLPALAVFVLARPRRMTRRQWGGVAVLVLLAAQAAAAAIIWMYHPFNVKLRQYAPERGTLHSVLDSFLGAVGTPLAGLARPLLGWLDTDMPSVVGAFAIGSFGAAVLVGLTVIFPRKVVALSVYVLLALASTMYLWLETNNLNTGLQSRYFLPILYVVAGLALLPRLDSGPVYPTRLQVGVIVVMVAVANAVALLVNFNRYIFGLPGVVSSPRMLRGQRPGWWWDSAPIGPFGSWLIGSVAFGAALALCWWLLPVARNFLGDKSATANEAGG